MRMKTNNEYETRKRERGETTINKQRKTKQQNTAKQTKQNKMKATKPSVM